jgi:hypothetical protein
LFIPICETDVASVIGWYATTVDNDSQDHESNASDNFQQAQSKFDLIRLVVNSCYPVVVTYLSIASDSKVLDDREKKKQRYDPSAVIDVLGAWPEVYDLARVRFDGSIARIILTLQAAEISNGRIVSHEMPYCHPQANPHEGSMNLTMYIVKAPFTGYITASSASACIMRYLDTIVRRLSRRTGNLCIPTS